MGSQAGADGRLVYFDHFRAVAILLIILGHSYHAWERTHLVEIAASNIITGGTALFVFISGFFYREVFYGRLTTAQFMVKKALFVLLPYLIMSVIGLFAFLVVRGALPSPVDFGFPSVAETLSRAALNLLTGHTITAYWYVPFIMLIFALSPAFDRFIRARPETRFALTALAFLIAAYAHRPTENLNPLHSSLYFLPFYLLGILYCQYRDRWDTWIMRLTPVIVVATLGSALLMVSNGQVGNLHKPFP